MNGEVWIRNAGPALVTEVGVMFIRALAGRPAPDTSGWHRLRGDLEPRDHLIAVAGLTAQSTKIFKVRVRWRDSHGHHLREPVLVVPRDSLAAVEEDSSLVDGFRLTPGPRSVQPAGHRRAAGPSTPGIR
jgi:hypothetical protein